MQEKIDFVADANQICSSWPTPWFHSATSRPPRTMATR
jgi:hypothetical protein